MKNRVIVVRYAHILTQFLKSEKNCNSPRSKFSRKNPDPGGLSPNFSRKI